MAQQQRFYANSVLTTNVTTAEATWELIAGTNGVRLFELGIALNAATASTILLARPAAKGVTPTTAKAFKPEGVNDGLGSDSSATTAVAWGTKPTAPADGIYMRRFGLPAEVGRSIVWTWENGLLIPAAASLVIFNGATNSALNVWARISE
jgi:hypothetical protein